MDYKDITNLIKLIGKSNLSEFKLKEGDFEIIIKTDKYQKGRKEIRHITSPDFGVSAPVYRPENDSNLTAESSAPVKVPSTPSSSGEQTDDHLLEIRSPIVGTFYRAPAPGKDPYIKIGDVIESGAVVCIVEAMKLFNEIESEISGKIVKSMVDDASPVEYDQVLFLVDPNA